MKSARKPLLLALLIGCSLLFGGAFAWQQLRVRTDWQRILPTIPNLDQAHPEFRKRVVVADQQARHHPRNPAVLAELTFLYLANGFDAQTETGLRLLAELQPNEARWQHLLARQLAGYGDIEAALPRHARAVALAPDYLPARIKWADALLRYNEIAAASEQYRAVLARQPDHRYALLGLARIDFEAGRLADARTRLERTVAANPTFTAAHIMLSTLLEKQGDRIGAAATRTKATNLGIFHDVEDPWNDDTLTYCYDTYRLRVAASALAYARQPQPAIALLERAVALKPKEARTHWQLGQVHRDLGNFSLARPELEQAISLDPKDPGPYLDLVRILKVQRDLQGALKLLTVGVQTCPDSSGLHYEYAQALVATGRAEEALPHLRDSQRLQPDDPAAYQEFAIQCFRLGREAEGVKALESAIVRIPQDGPILALLVRYHIHTGHEIEAESYRRRAMETDLDPATLPELDAAFLARFGRSPNPPAQAPAQ